MLTGTACASQDVDLLTYDPIPQKKESDAPPVDVLPPEVKPAPVIAPVKKAEKPAPAAAPVTPPSRPQPPVEVAKPKPAEPAAKKVVPPAKKQEAAPAPVVKSEPKPEVVVTPPPAAALPKAAEVPAVRPVLKVTEPDLKQDRPDPAARSERPARVEKEIKKDVMKHAGPKPVVVPPPTLNADIDPVHPDELHDAAPVRAVQENVKVEPPPAPEASVKVKDAVIQLGDPIKIDVAGESDLSGWYKVSNDGSVVLPIIGKVRAQGFTHAKLAEILTDTLKDGYLVNPVVTVTGKAAP